MNFDDELMEIRIRTYKKKKLMHLSSRSYFGSRFWRLSMIGRLLYMRWVSERKYGTHNKVIDNYESKQFKDQFPWIWKGPIT